MTIHNECHNQSRFFRVTHTCCSITFLFYLPWPFVRKQPSQCHNLPVILKIISRNFPKFAKFPKNFTIIKSSKNYQKQSITRPSVDYAKDWPDQGRVRASHSLEAPGWQRLCQSSRLPFSVSVIFCCKPSWCTKAKTFGHQPGNSS